MTDTHYTVYEERRVVVTRGSLGAYRRMVLESVWPALVAAGARPLCLLSGLIGARAEETFLFTGFADLAAWQQAQARITGVDMDARADGSAVRERVNLIEEEQVRLLLPSDVRPKAETPTADRRAVYGMRRFTVTPADWHTFVQHSAGGIWPRIESQGAAILGLFRDAATTDPLDVTLLTGYHGPAHWESTRVGSEAMNALPTTLREGDTQARTGRGAMTLRSYVRLMSAHWPEA